MNDQEIYTLATKVIGMIANDLSEGIYRNLGGNLSVSWSYENRVTAWAESTSLVSEPPRHNVVISYELTRKFYRDAEDFHAFCKSDYFENRLAAVFRDFDPKPRLPTFLTHKESVENMFIGAITWVFFHELGHLQQEHGYIRSHFNKAGQLHYIEDCELNHQQKFEPRAAAIFHATEFAADHEATVWVLEELARHFLQAHGEWSLEHVQSFHDSLFLVICGFSCAFYRFYGERPTDPEPLPASSHPTPVRRLEACLPVVYELLHLIESKHGLNRRQLVCLASGAASSAGFFWLSLHSNRNDVPDNFMIQGLLNDPHKTTYWTSIVDIWDEIEPEIIKIRRFGTNLGLLSFTDEFRDKLTIL